MNIQKRVASVFQEIVDLGNKEEQFHIASPYIMPINILMICLTWDLKRWQIGQSYTIDQYIEGLIMAMARENN
jgi:hypothetical protein